MKTWCEAVADTYTEAVLAKVCSFRSPNVLEEMHIGAEPA